MRVVFLAVDDEFAGSMQQYVYEQHPEWVVGSVISTCAIYKKSKFNAMVFVLQRSGFLFAAEMFRMKIIRKLIRKEKKITPAQLAQKHKVEIFYSKNINEDESVTRLKSWTPDLIISTNFSHYIGDRVSKISRYGTWNLHKSYLPYYRGMAPSFYALLNGEKEVGVTLHKIAKSFDTGDIIKQSRVPVAPDDTVYSLNQKTSKVGGRMMARFLAVADLENIFATPQPPGDWLNYSYPTRADIKAFRKKGCRF
jgi:folate-dependent phosphoribosylglycinamide formyltransferase PurN